MCALRAASVALIFAAALPAVAARVPESGSLTGRVVLAGRIRGVPLPSNAYQPRSINRRGGETLPEITNVVVYLKDVAFTGFMSRKAYTRTAWDQQVGASIVWARRWW